MQLNTRNRGVFEGPCQVAMTTKVSVRIQELISLKVIANIGYQQVVDLLLQTSKPFIKFSCSGKWKTVSNHLKCVARLPKRNKTFRVFFVSQELHAQITRKI